MTDVVGIDGGPAGLSTALFAARNDPDTVVFDADRTRLHKARLFNYLGVRGISGEGFLAIAHGQTRDRGADLREQEVTSVESSNDGGAIRRPAPTSVRSRAPRTGRCPSSRSSPRRRGRP